MPKRKTSFNPEWGKEHEFIAKSRKDEFHAFCKICHCDVEIGSKGKGAIERHAGTDKHKVNTRTATGSSSQNSYFSSVLSSQDDRVGATELYSTAQINFSSMEDRMLSLKWNDHNQSFFEMLSTVRKKESFSDVTLICDGRFYPAHKLVLATCSEFFNDMFNRIDCKKPMVIVGNTSQKDLEALLDYMYLGEVNVLQSELENLMQAAKTLKIRGLTESPDNDVSFPSGGRRSGIKRRRQKQVRGPPGKRLSLDEPDRADSRNSSSSVASSDPKSIWSPAKTTSLSHQEKATSQVDQESTSSVKAEGLECKVEAIFIKEEPGSYSGENEETESCDYKESDCTANSSPWNMPVTTQPQLQDQLPQTIPGPLVKQGISCQVTASSSKYVCPYCCVQLNSRQSLHSHKKAKHPEVKKVESTTRASVQCPKCEVFSCGTLRELISHLNSTHDTNFQIREAEFQSKDDFEEWKSSTEKCSGTWFVKRQGDSDYQYHVTSYYVCNRSGNFKTAGTGKRALKSQGSSKINGSCSAFIRQTTHKSTGKVSVEYCVDHTHETDAAHLKMSDDLRAFIVGELASGVDSKILLDRIRSQAQLDGRDSLLTHRDILNIKKQYNIPGPQQDILDDMGE